MSLFCWVVVSACAVFLGRYVCLGPCAGRLASAARAWSMGAAAVRSQWSILVVDWPYLRVAFAAWDGIVPRHVRLIEDEGAWAAVEVIRRKSRYAHAEESTQCAACAASGTAACGARGAREGGEGGKQDCNRREGGSKGYEMATGVMGAG